MANRFLRYVQESDAQITPEELREAYNAIDAKLAKVRTYKEMYRRFQDERRLEEMIEEEELLLRLRAEYDLLVGNFGMHGEEGI